MSSFLGTLESSNLYGTSDSTPVEQPTQALTTTQEPNRLVKEVTPAPADTDGATAATVKKMCEYIAKAASSPLCQRVAHEALQFALGDPNRIAWGVFFAVKHRVKFSRDEPRLFQSGDPEALDLLVAPDVLLSQPKPTEDCDGFTMLACCLLTILQVPAYIITVATDPGDNERWSHVFAMANVNGQLTPIDASHGKAPGWMVPKEHIFRWQAWDMQGNKVDVPIPARNTLHGYVPRRMFNRPMIPRRLARPPKGLGQNGDGSSVAVVTTSGGNYSVASDGSVYDPNGTLVTDFSTLPNNVNNAINAALDSGQPQNANLFSNLTPSQLLGTSTSTSTSGGTNIGQILNSIVQGGLKAAQLATLPAGYTINPATGQLVYTGQAQAGAMLTASFASILPWLAIAGVGIVAFMLISSSGKR